MKKAYYIKYILFFLLLSGIVSGQTKNHVFTKSITKEFNYKKEYSLNIEGEKAEIIIQTWKKNKINIELELISKNPDKKIAKNDLKKMEYSFEQHGDNIYLRNLILKDGNKIASALKAKYTITLPEECPVYLKNNYGNSTVSNLTNSLKINSEFSTIGLNDLMGHIMVSSYFGDITGSRINGIVNINARRSDVTFRNIAGNFDINSHYGIVKLFTDNSLLNLNILAEKSDVYFFDPNPGDYGYTLTAHYGNVTVPEDLKFDFREEKNKEVKKAYFTPGKEMGTISIKITFGDISIRNL